MKSRSSEPSSPERAYLAALRLLNSRDYSVARLREKLGSKGYEEADVAAALERLVAEGWLNDRRFAERFVESALASGRYFGPRLRQEMQRRGIPRELTAELLGRLLTEYDEAKEVRFIVERRFSGFLFPTASEKEKRRIIGYFLRRGFSFSAVMNALKGAD